MSEWILLRVRLTPKGGRDALMKWEEETLFARVAAPPVDGAANRALIALLSNALALPKSRIAFQSGETARIKTLRVEGIDAETMHARIAHALKIDPSSFPLSRKLSQ